MATVVPKVASGKTHLILLEVTVIRFYICTHFFVVFVSACKDTTGVCHSVTYPCFFLPAVERGPGASLWGDGDE